MESGGLGSELGGWSRGGGLELGGGIRGVGAGDWGWGREGWN